MDKLNTQDIIISKDDKINTCIKTIARMIHERSLTKQFTEIFNKIKSSIVSENSDEILFTIDDKKYGIKFFERPNTRFFNLKMVETTEKWLIRYGPRKALIFGRFIPFARTLINPICGVVNLERKLFSTWNAIGAIIWTQVAICIGYLLGDLIEGSVNKYLLPIVGIVVFVSILPIIIDFLRKKKDK
jgi:hypothetical protein